VSGHSRRRPPETQLPLIQTRQHLSRRPSSPKSAPPPIHRSFPKQENPKINPESVSHFSSPQKTTAYSPRPPRKTPQPHHKITTPKHPSSPKTQQNTTNSSLQKKAGVRFCQWSESCQPLVRMDLVRPLTPAPHHLRSGEWRVVKLNEITRNKQN
jgi:hypothetical protein